MEEKAAAGEEGLLLLHKEEGKWLPPPPPFHKRLFLFSSLDSFLLISLTNCLDGDAWRGKLLHVADSRPSQTGAEED
jgi:hypothetical protein